MIISRAPKMARNKPAQADTPTDVARASPTSVSELEIDTPPTTSHHNYRPAKAARQPTGSSADRKWCPGPESNHRHADFQ
jgi:hypothetical protein